MSRSKYIVAAFALAILATFIGWSQTLAHKVFPPAHLAIWFPLIFITHTSDIGVATALSLFQFPLLAMLFMIGIRRWSLLPVSIVVGFIYAVMVLMAFLLFKL